MVTARIKKLRQQEGLTLLQLALETGIDPSALSRYERGKRRITLDHAFVLATFFECSVEFLMGRENGDNGQRKSEAA